MKEYMIDFGSIFLTAKSEDEAYDKLKQIKPLLDQIEPQNEYYYQFVKPDNDDYRDDVWEYEFMACKLKARSKDDARLTTLKQFPIHTYINCDDADFSFDTNIKGYDDSLHTFNGIKLCDHDIYRKGI